MNVLVSSPMVIRSVSLHQVDVTGDKIERVEISEYNDLQNYLSELYTEINSETEKRSYEFPEHSTTFKSTLDSYHLAGEFDISLANAFSGRLLEFEKLADKKMERLHKNKDGHVNKGSFLQVLFEQYGKIVYLGIKIDSQIFIDEEDFKRKAGLSVNRKVYKSVKVIFDGEGKYEKVSSFDKNTKPAVYWWKEFLELKEERDDKYNTRVCSEEVVRAINTLKRDCKADYTLLRNAALVHMKQDGHMKYDELVSSVFESYVPVSDSLDDVRYKKFVAKIEELPTKKNFDREFYLIPSEVNYRRVNVKLSNEVSLSYDEDTKDLDKKIWAQTLDDGRKVVVVHSPEGHDFFTNISSVS